MTTVCKKWKRTTEMRIVRRAVGAMLLEHGRNEEMLKEVNLRATAMAMEKVGMERKENT